MTDTPKGKSPAFQFYPADYLADASVQMLTLEEEGAYLRALCYCWREGSIPADPERLARLIGKGCTKEVGQAIARLFVPHPTRDGDLTHARLDRERTKQEKFSKKMSESGKKGARARWDSGNGQQPRRRVGHGQAIARPMASDSSSSASSSSNNPPYPLSGVTGPAPKTDALKRAPIPVPIEAEVRTGRTPEERASVRALIDAKFPNMRRAE